MFHYFLTENGYFLRFDDETDFIEESKRTPTRLYIYKKFEEKNEWFPIETADDKNKNKLLIQDSNFPEITEFVFDGTAGGYIRTKLNIGIKIQLLNYGSGSVEDTLNEILHSPEMLCNEVKKIKQPKNNEVTASDVANAMQATFKAQGMPIDPEQIQQLIVLDGDNGESRPQAMEPKTVLDLVNFAEKEKIRIKNTNSWYMGNRGRKKLEAIQAAIDAIGVLYKDDENENEKKAEKTIWDDSQNTHLPVLAARISGLQAALGMQRNFSFFHSPKAKSLQNLIQELPAVDYKM